MVVMHMRIHLHCYLGSRQGIKVLIISLVDSTFLSMKMTAILSGPGYTGTWTHGHGM